MAKIWENIIFFVLNIFLIVRLAVSYGDYSACISPIHKWFMGWLGFLFVFRVLLVFMDIPRMNNCFVVLLGLMLGPLSIIFLFVWNVIGTVWIIQIEVHGDVSKCISTGSVVFTFVIIAVVYLVYVFLIIVLVSLCRMKSTILRKKKQLFKDLTEMYNELLSPGIKETSIHKLIQIKNNLKKLLKDNLKIIKNTEMEDFEKAPMIHYFKSEIIDDTESISSNSSDENPDLETDNPPQNIEMNMNSNQNVLDEYRSSRLSNIGQHGDRLTQPLMGIMGRDTRKKQLERRMSLIRDKSDPNSDDCIICFNSLENFSGALKFECSHQFHSECIFDWLKINPTCPMCRRNFRVDLINRMVSHLDELINRTYQDNA